VDAGKRFGKTKWLLLELIQKAHEKVGEYWYVGPTYKQAKTTVWKELMEMIPPILIKGRPREGELKMSFKCGSNLFLKGSDDPDSLRGPELDGVGLDERAYQVEDVWSRIIRGQLTKRHGFAYFISSPNFRGRNHWTKFCKEAQRRQLLGDKSWAYWHFTIYDNPELSVDEIEDLKATVPSYVWDLEFMAKTSNIAGQLYGEFDFDRDVEEMKVGDGWKRYRGLDHGLDHPESCVWGAVNLKDMFIYIYDEYCRPGCTISQNCDAIKQHTGSDVIEWTVVDPSTAKRDPNTKKTYMFEYSYNGVPCIPGERSQRGVDLLKMCLERGRVKVHPKCKTLIYQLQNVQFGDRLEDDCCLVGDTKILCKDGEKNLEDIIVGDKVFTREGFKRVLRSEMTNKSADLYKLKLSNGKSLTGTFNHPIFLIDGSIRKLGDLKAGDKLIDKRCSYLIQLNICKLISYLRRFKSLTESAIIYVESISSIVTRRVENLYSCIGQFGSIILERYLKSITFTTLTTTGRTTTSPILNCYQNQSTADGTWEAKNARLLQGKFYENSQDQWRQSGIDRKRQSHSINGLVNFHGLKKDGVTETVISVAEFIRHLFQSVLNGVIRIAETLTLGHALEVSEVKPLSTKSSVYNLYIEGQNEYFANGILTHNCDALKYLVAMICDTIPEFRMMKVADPKGERVIGIPRGEHFTSLLDERLFGEQVEQLSLNWLSDEVNS